MRSLLCVLFLISATILFAQTNTNDAGRARVYVTDSKSWEIGGVGGGTAGGFGTAGGGGDRPQTAEIIKTFGERCPDVVANNKQERADYVVLLDHEGGKEIFLRDKQSRGIQQRRRHDPEPLNPYAWELRERCVRGNRERLACAPRDDRE